MRVIDYSLIESDSHEELVQTVATACRDDGWLPCGGACVWFEPPRPREPDDAGNPIRGVVHYAQTLVKYGA